MSAVVSLPTPQTLAAIEYDRTLRERQSQQRVYRLFVERMALKGIRVPERRQHLNQVRSGPTSPAGRVA